MSTQYCVWRHTYPISTGKCEYSPTCDHDPHKGNPHIVDWKYCPYCGGRIAIDLEDVKRDEREKRL